MLHDRTKPRFGGAKRRFCARPLDRAANGALQRCGVDLAFGEVIVGACFHCQHVDGVVTLSGEQDRRRVASARLQRTNQIQSALFAKPEIDQVDVVVDVGDLVQCGGVGGGPAHFVASS